MKEHPGQKGRRTKEKPKSDHPREWPEWIDALLAQYEKGSAAKRQWANKAGNAFLELLDLSDECLAEAASETDDMTAVIRAMSSPETLKLLKGDPLSDSFLRGVEARNRLFKQNGGVWDTERVAQFLGMTAQAVNKRRSGRKLLGVMFRRKGYLYPAWQFSESGTIPGLDHVLMALREHDEWMQHVFFITPNGHTDDRRPLDLLREGDIDSAVEAAKSFGEQGAS